MNNEEQIDRLIEILNNTKIQSQTLKDLFYKSVIEKIAYQLLENGIIVPPAKVGDKVYQKDTMYPKCSVYNSTPLNSLCTGCCVECDSKSSEYMYTGIISYMMYNGEQFSYVVQWYDKWDNSHYVIGKNIFLTENEEALKALKGGAE